MLTRALSALAVTSMLSGIAAAAPLKAPAFPRTPHTSTFLKTFDNMKRKSTTHTAACTEVVAGLQATTSYYAIALKGTTALSAKQEMAVWKFRWKGSVFQKNIDLSIPSFILHNKPFEERRATLAMASNRVDSIRRIFRQPEKLTMYAIHDKTARVDTTPPPKAVFLLYNRDDTNTCEKVDAVYPPQPVIPSLPRS